jgi:hypothetical protein
MITKTVGRSRRRSTHGRHGRSLILVHAHWNRGGPTEYGGPSPQRASPKLIGRSTLQLGVLGRRLDRREPRRIQPQLLDAHRCRALVGNADLDPRRA